MKPHPRIRKTVKWGGAVLCVLMAGVWVGSGWIEIRFRLWERATGTIACGRFTSDYYSFESRFLSEVDVPPETIEWHEIPHGPRWTWWFDSGYHADPKGCPPFDSWAETPFWFPLLLTLIPTTLAWRLDTLARRRVRLGLCPHCHYDRRGIAATAVCPECGKAAAAAPVAQQS